jgi:hypothetical protein
MLRRIERSRDAILGDIAVTREGAIDLLEENRSTLYLSGSPIAGPPLCAGLEAKAM